MNKHMWWAWALRSIAHITCWTAMAIYFDKWWIALFALLFSSSVSSKKDGDRNV